MSSRPRIVLALTPLVERTIEDDLFGSATTVEVVASASEADELNTLVSAHEADAVLLSPDLSGLSGAHCARASAAGLRVIGLALDVIGREALAGLGVDEVLVHPLADGALVEAVRGPANIPAKPAVRRSAPKKKTDGTVIAVVGAQGAPGASECAASLAALASARWDAVLAEVDAIGPSLDVRLGADALDGSLAAVARAVQGEEPELPDLFARWIVTRPGWPPVLLGAPEPTRDLARPGAASKAIRALASSHPLVFCDVGFLLATEDPDGTPSIARIHRETISIADAVVLVLGARDVQLRHGLAQLDVLADSLDISPERLRIVINGVGGPAAGSRLELESALLPRLAERGIGVDVWIPSDRRSLVLARRRGLPLASVRARGPYRRALVQLLHELFLPTAPIARARKQRLAMTATTTPTDRGGRDEVALPWR